MNNSIIMSHLRKSNNVVTLTEFTHFLHLLVEESSSFECLHCETKTRSQRFYTPSYKQCPSTKSTQIHQYYNTKSYFNNDILVQAKINHLFMKGHEPRIVLSISNFPTLNARQTIRQTN